MNVFWANVRWEKTKTRHVTGKRYVVDDYSWRRFRHRRRDSIGEDQSYIKMVQQTNLLNETMTFILTGKIKCFPRYDFKLPLNREALKCSGWIES